LFVDDFKSEQFKKSRHSCTSDFMEFAKRIGVASNRAEKLLQPFLERQPFMESLISRSFLSEANKRGYLMMYNNKRNCLIGG
jgi:serine/threonine-protein kinase HipA